MCCTTWDASFTVYLTTCLNIPGSSFCFIFIWWRELAHSLHNSIWHLSTFVQRRTSSQDFLLSCAFAEIFHRYLSKLPKTRESNFRFLAAPFIWTHYLSVLRQLPCHLSHQTLNISFLDFFKWWENIMKIRENKKNECKILLQFIS